MNGRGSNRSNVPASTSSVIQQHRLLLDMSSGQMLPIRNSGDRSSDSPNSFEHGHVSPESREGFRRSVWQTSSRLSVALPVQQLWAAIEALLRLSSRTFQGSLTDGNGGPQAIVHINTATPLREAMAIESAILNTEANLSALARQGYLEEADLARHNDTCTLIKLSALVLVARFKQLLFNSSPAADANLDHSVQTLMLHVLAPSLHVTSFEALFWSLCIGAPFLATGTPLRQRSAVVVAKLCSRLGLSDGGSVATWERARRLLDRLYYIPSLQEALLLEFWSEVREGIVMLRSVSDAPVTEESDEE